MGLVLAFISYKIEKMFIKQTVFVHIQQIRVKIKKLKIVHAARLVNTLKTK